jgi:HAE1 family hydrophobic/amphiphilic exporter-1
MLITLLLAVGVVYLFLHNGSATLIPALALPFSILGTFAVMKVMNYSLDNLSMMALILSISFIVDDAIVMLENVVRHLEKGEAPLEAALSARRNRLHDCDDDHVAGGGLHPDSVHGRRPR